MAMNLSVNLNKVALLRNSRGADNPGPVHAARTCIDAGVAGITLHLREDRRHTREDDVRAIARLCKDRGVEFNLEGDPRPELLAIAREVRPTQFTLVPVTPGEITSDHGWDLPRQHDQIAPIIEEMKGLGMRLAIFLDPITETMDAVAATGTDRIEIYTEPYAAAFGSDGQAAALADLKACAQAATERGMGVNAGHDLDLLNTPLVAREVPEILEVSIGHALIADALYLGLEETIRRYLAVTGGDPVEAPVTK